MTVMTVITVGNKEIELSWIDKIPTHWTMKKIKYLVNRLDLPPKSDDEVITAFRDGEVTLRKNRREDGFTFSIKEIGYQHINKGNLVVHQMDAFAGAIGISDSDGKASPVYTVCEAINEEEIYLPYLNYQLRVMSETKYIESLAKGIRERSTDFRWTDMGPLIALLPPLEEQKGIVAFIELKKAQIEQLINGLQRLVKILEEKRQAIITEIVTKGLNPNVKMKHSGVEWIGEIPEHWNIKKVGYLGRLQNGISKSAEEFGFGKTFISYGDVYKNMVLPQNVSGLVNSSTLEQQLYSVKKGDVFFTRTSETIEEIGFASTCLETIPDATFAGFLIRFRPNSLLLIPNYAKYYFRSDLRRHYFVKEMNLVTRASLGQGLLRNFPVILPNINEQTSIASYLDDQTKTIDSSVSLIKEQIEKLKEYRQSLIYEAVTGKIDVRNIEVVQ